MYDPATIRHLEDLGVSSGWHCLEVGGGGGSIAAWLAARSGSVGRVLVTDIDTRFLESLEIPNLEVRRHDIINDPLPEATFDLVHSRLVLLHLPEREKALARMVAALKPGGWLVDEEFDASSMPPNAVVNPGEVLLKALIGTRRVMQDKGADDRTFARQLFSRLRAHGLVEVAAEASIFMWNSGSPGVSLLRANFEQLRSNMIDAGYITEEEFNHDIARLDDPNFMMPSPIMWTVWGRRP
jgi:SAM-dependent methyltransferase